MVGEMTVIITLLAIAVLFLLFAYIGLYNEIKEINRRLIDLCVHRNINLNEHNRIWEWLFDAEIYGYIEDGYFGKSYYKPDNIIVYLEDVGFQRNKANDGAGEKSDSNDTDYRIYE